MAVHGFEEGVRHTACPHSAAGPPADAANDEELLAYFY